MQAVILAGGLGTRLSEETTVRPKPMVEIGERPILWHIMKGLAQHGINEFIICLGYKGDVIKDYFVNYLHHSEDIKVDLKTGTVQVFTKNVEPWQVTLAETGQDTGTGGRVKRIQKYIRGPFLMTYGDGVADVDVPALQAFHKESGKLATVTAVRPPARFGALELNAEDEVTRFIEKPLGDGGWINGGFFILQREVFRYIEGDTSIFEKAPLTKLSAERQLAAYRHSGFWHPMDTLRDKRYLNELWDSGDAPWQTWNDKRTVQKAG